SRERALRLIELLLERDLADCELIAAGLHIVASPVQTPLTPCRLEFGSAARAVRGGGSKRVRSDPGERGPPRKIDDQPSAMSTAVVAGTNRAGLSDPRRQAVGVSGFRQ